MPSWDNPKPVWALSIFVVGCMVLISLTFLLPWFTVYSNDEGVVERQEYYHNRYRYISDDYDEYHDYDNRNSPGADLIKTGEWSRNLRVAALVSLLGLVFCLALAASKKINRLIPLALFLPPSLLSTGTLFYTAVSYPPLALEYLDVKNPTFIGEEGVFSWGPGLGWFLMLLAVFAVLGCIIAYSVFLWRESSSERNEEHS